MQQLLITWAILRLIWEAKGYSMKEMPGILLARWTGRKGLAFSSLQRKAKNAQGAPEDVTDFITDEKTLPTREGHETTAKLLRLGMAALFGNAAADPGPTQGRLSTTQTRPTMRGWLSRKLDALASSAFSLLAKLTSAEAKLKAALALITSKLDALASAVTSKLDALASAITSKLDGLASSLGSLLTMLTGARRTLDAVNGKLDNVLGTLGQVAATVNHIDAKGDLAEYARERESRRVMRAVGLVGLLGLVGFAAVLVLLVGVLFAVRQNQSPPSSVNVNLGTGAAEEAAKRQGADVIWQVLAIEMGKPKGRPMPHQPLPGQDVAPCKGSAVTLYGACWFLSGYAAPCPPDLFEEGGKCYGAIHAVPGSSPSSQAPPPSPNPEHR